MAYTGTFTDSDKVRREAGFTNNTYIDDTLDVKPHIDDAESVVISSLSQRYTLPLSDNAYWSGSSGEQVVIAICTLLASARLLLQQYEGQGGDMSEMAYKKLGEVKGRLKMIEDGRLKLFGTDNEELQVHSTQRSAITSYPDSDAESFKFTADQEF